MKERLHLDGPSPTISDDWGGIDESMMEVYEVVPEYSGKSRPPTRKQARPGWHKFQMVKQIDAHCHLDGIHIRAMLRRKERPDRADEQQHSLSGTVI